MMLQETNLVNLIAKFGGNDEKCRTYLEHLKWPDGPKCDLCGSKATKIANRPQYDCDSCHYQFSVTAHTIFHDSHLPLWKWFLATYLIVESKKGMSANQLKRTLEVSYKTAWYLCHRIRKAMTEVNASKLSASSRSTKPMWAARSVMRPRQPRQQDHGARRGPTRRRDQIRVEHRTRRPPSVLHQFVKENTAPNTKRLITDELPATMGIADADTTHETVNHRAEEWVRGDVHTNTIEGVWSLFKRSIVGSYHQISTKHMDAYLDEFEWRFNQRDNQYLFRDTMLRLLASPKMEFKELIEKSA